MHPSIVGVHRADRYAAYAKIAPPFNPDASYPELSPRIDVDASNSVFRAFRELLHQMRWDEANYGSSSWNPLGWAVKPGQTVLLKPNMVVSEHPAGDIGVRWTNTDGPFIRCVAEYVLLALKGQGRLIIGDSPIKETDFVRAAEITGIRHVVADLSARSAVPIELVDFRDFVSARDDVAMVGGVDQQGDPRGYTAFDLREHSELADVSAHATRFRSTAVYYENRMAETHNSVNHRYSIANSVLHADTFINIPKLKTHCKAGVTVALKNLVGICNEKRWLPHHRKGPPSKGGDEYGNRASIGIRGVETLKDFLVQNRIGKVIYPRLMLVNKIGRALTGVDVVRRIRDQGDPYQNGGWHGNDTVWRMVLDLNKILRYGNTDGTLSPKPVRHILTFVDGIWAGEAEGPLKPSSKEAGIMMFGLDSVLLDIVAATLMGFDYREIKLLERGLALRDHPLLEASLSELTLMANEAGWQTLDGIASSHLAFVPPRGWRGHIELAKTSLGTLQAQGSQS